MAYSEKICDERHEKIDETEKKTDASISKLHDRINSIVIMLLIGIATLAMGFLTIILKGK